MYICSFTDFLNCFMVGFGLGVVVGGAGIFWALKEEIKKGKK